MKIVRRAHWLSFFLKNNFFFDTCVACVCFNFHSSVVYYFKFRFEWHHKFQMHYLRKEKEKEKQQFKIRKLQIIEFMKCALRTSFTESKKPFYHWYWLIIIENGVFGDSFNRNEFVNNINFMHNKNLKRKNCIFLDLVSHSLVKCQLDEETTSFSMSSIRLCFYNKISTDYNV